MNTFTYTDMLAHFGISSAHPGGSELTKRILKTEAISTKMKVLDIGCGTGQTAAFVAKKYHCDVFAVDQNAIMVEKAKKRVLKEKLSINIREGSAEKLPFANNSFDFILAESVISFTNAKLSLPEMFRVLKKRGKLLTIEMTAEEKLSVVEKNEISKAYGIQNIFLETEWKKQFFGAGFSEVNVERDEKQSAQYTDIDKNDPSEFIHPDLFKIIEVHSQLLQKYQGRLGYRIYRCLK